MNAVKAAAARLQAALGPLDRDIKADLSFWQRLFGRKAKA
jgi:hypothetical protein